MDRVNGADFIDLGGGKRGFRDEDLPTGVPGTEVPADWLNGVQEEVLGIIETSGLAPNAADRSQLGKAIQSGKLNYVVGGGTAAALTGTLAPAPTAYTIGMAINLKVATPNTGAATLNLNGLGAKSILNSDGSALAPNDLSGTVTLIYNGTAFVMSNVSAATETARGVVELASLAEATAGTDTTRPAAVARMAAAVQAGTWSMATTGGTANAQTATLVPAPAAYSTGMVVNLTITTPNTGPTTLNLNGLGAKNIVNSDGTALAASDLSGTVTLIYNGTAFVITNVSAATEAARGVVELASAAETTAGTDLTRPAAVGRMAAAAQAGSWNYAVAAGTANAITATLVPGPTAYVAGMVVNLKITTPNTAAATLNLNGLGVVSILGSDGSALAANDLSGIVTLIYNGAAFVMTNVSGATETARGVVELASAAETTAGADLTRPAAVARVAAAVQAGTWSMATAGGTANAQTATLVPAPAAYSTGMVVNLTITTPNTGPATLNLNGLGAKNIVNSDGSALAASDLSGTVTLIYNGTAFVITNVSAATEAARGVVELASAAETTAGTDLTRPAAVARMAAAVQSFGWSYTVAGGTASALTAVLTPVPASYASLKSVLLKTPASGNLPGATLNINGLGALPIVTSTGDAVALNDLSPNSLVTLLCDGTKFYLTGIALSQIKVKLTGVTTFYVRSDGNDANTGLANTSGAAFQTIQGAFNAIKTRYDASGYTITIQLGAAGTYEGVAFEGFAGNIILQGDPANPASYVVTRQGTSLWCVRTTMYSVTLRGVKITRSVAGVYSLYTLFGGQVSLDSVVLEATGPAAATAQYHTYTLNAGYVGIIGTVTIIGSCSAVFLVQSMGIVGATAGAVFVISGSPAWSVGFVSCQQARADFGNASFSGTPTGPRYNVAQNGVIDIAGQGANFLPGSSAGSAATGGLYV